VNRRRRRRGARFQLMRQEPEPLVRLQFWQLADAELPLLSSQRPEPSVGLIEQVPLPDPVDRVITLSQFSEIDALLGARSLAEKP